MTFTRFVIGAGAVMLVVFAVLMAIAVGGAFTPVVAFAVLFILIGSGNLLYGKHSHGIAAKNRVRPAQEAQNRAIDEAQERARQEREKARQQRAARAGRGLWRRRNGEVSR